MPACKVVTRRPAEIERETLFHQSDPLLEFAGIRCRPPQEEHSGAAHHRKVVLLRQLKQLRRKIATASPLATELKDDRTMPHCQGEAVRMGQAPSQRDGLGTEFHRLLREA